MNKRILNIIISLIIISLLGIITVQYLWIKNAVKIKEEQFKRSVNEAMNDAVNKLETREDIDYMRKNLKGDSLHMLVRAFTCDSILSLNSKLDSLLIKEEFNIPAPPPPPSPSSPGTNGFYFNYVWHDDPLSIDSLTSGLQNLTVVIPEDFEEYFEGYRDINDLKKFDSLMQKYHRQNMIFSPGHRFDNTRHQSGQIIMKKQLKQLEKNYPGKNQGKNLPVFPGRKPSDNNSRGTSVKVTLKKISDKARKINDVINKMAFELETKPLPINSRIDKNNLERILKRSLAEKNINVPFEYSILSPSGKSDSLPIKSEHFKKEFIGTPHQVSLFPNEIFQKPDRLLVYFPGETNILLKSISWLLLGSILFTIVITITSFLSIFTMLRQKKISDIKTDFINNMTHEFKTPLATISIAVDSINNPKVIAEPERIKSFTRVIKEENNRMNTRVEQILQMALLDSSELRLQMRPIDLNSLVEKVSNHFRLQIESREGRMEMDLNATEPMANCDETHLSNVLMNLLDNANKYSPSRPEIKISTNNSEANIVILVEDKGIGMNPETQHKIFDKFFRVTSGNIHNVKGFGLGLSYSKAIILAHKGEIKVKSEPGKGSLFTISLPYLKNENA